jgi:hypothetical protein
MPIINYSPASKWKTFVFCLFLFPLGVHAFYVKRYKRGFFFLFSIFGVVSYYLFFIFKVKKALSGVTFLKKLTSMQIFFILLIGGSLMQHIPFLDWTKYLSTYLVYLFLIGIVLWVYDLLCILSGTFRDAEHRKVVRLKLKDENLS